MINPKRIVLTVAALLAAGGLAVAASAAVDGSAMASKSKGPVSASYAR